jgi:voltage-gated potassium channel
MAEPLRWGRLARVVRIVRRLRGVRSSKRLAEYVMRRRAQSAFMGAALTALLVVVFSSIAILHFESAKAETANIKTAGDALWWAFVTVTTVGYGDRYPVTPGGRIVAAVAMTAGVGLFGTFTGFVASWFLEPAEQEQESEFADIRRRLDVIQKHLESSQSAVDRRRAADDFTRSDRSETC